MRLTWEQVGAWRMERQHLLKRVQAKSMLDVVSRLCGVQAQLMSSAEMALAARVDGIKPDDVRSALWTDHSLVKTWMMRGTLHLISAADYPLYVGAGSTRDGFRKPVWQRYFKITDTEIDGIMDGVYAALDGRTLGREQLADEVVRVTGSAHLGERLRSGWGEFLKPASYNGKLVFGPSEGQNVTFARPDQLIGAFEPVDPREAMLEVARRYLSVYGPATKNDFALWWGSDPGPVTKLFRQLADELVDVTVGDWKGVALVVDTPSLESTKPTDVVRLLPGFDVYTLRIVKQSAYFIPEGMKGRVSRTAGWITPVVIVGGRVEGVWKYEKKKDALVVTVELFVPQRPDLEAGISAEADRLGQFLGAPATVSYESVL